MIDFHSHILPGIDDGSPDPEESRRMLEALAAQNVDLVALTSHYYANRRTPEEFLERRQAAFERLRPVLTEEMPRVCLGAEVLYFRGITRMEALPRLRLEGTRLLLLEMPFAPWSEGEVREVVDLCHDPEFVVLLAHIERYLKFQKAAVWDLLLSEGAMMQSNASFLLPLLQQRRAVSMIREGRIHVLGSDCHNMSSRPPRMGEALAVLRKRLGRRETNRFLDRSYDYLEDWRV
ncbi:MAG: capsular polysaccharide biosynthesis protein [Oscillospiraceae bacterium]|nr:capsular polysaccharide biosynthesis protein [Oscillospiraceae bacterium]